MRKLAGISFVACALVMFVALGLAGGWIGLGGDEDGSVLAASMSDVSADADARDGSVHGIDNGDDNTTGGSTADGPLAGAGGQEVGQAVSQEVSGQDSEGDGCSVVEEGGSSFVAGEVLVGFDSSLGAEALCSSLTVAGIAVSDVEIVSEDSGGSSCALVTFAEDASVNLACEQLEGSGIVEYAEPNYIYTVADPDPATDPDLAIATDSALTNDPREEEQWEHEAIGLADAWGVSKASGGVTVAILDTGVDYDHPDLADNLVLGSYAKNVATEQTGAEAVDDANGHGTHTAGIIAAVADNETGIAGVSYNAKVLPIRVTHMSNGEIGWGDYGKIYVSDIVEAIDYVVALKTTSSSPDELKSLRVISMSLYGTSKSTAYSQAVQRATDAGLLVVAAVGNDSSDEVSYPAAYDGVLGVSALKQADGNPGIAFDSSYSNYGSYVDVSAPGTNILSTYRNAKYARMSGTSMAAPVVAASAALVYAADPDMSVVEVTSLLESTALDLGEAGRDDEYGYGALQIGAALERWKLCSGEAGLVEDGSDLLWSNGDGTFARSEFKQANGAWYYFDEKGYACTGLQCIEDKWYYFGQDHIRISGLVTVDGTTMYFDPQTGERVQGKFVRDTQDPSKVYYFRSTDGSIITGLAKIYGVFRYFDENGVRCYGAQDVLWDGAVNDDSGSLAHNDGQVHEMYFEDSGDKPSGAMLSGFVKLYKDGSGHVSASEAKTMADDSLYDVYYYRINGGKLYGLAKIYGLWRYLDPTTGVRCYGRQSVLWDGVVNDDSGSLAHNDGQIHEMYFDAQGARPTGIMKSGEFLAFDKQSGEVVDSGVAAGTYDNGTYDVRYYKIRGDMATGRVRVYGTWYTFGEDGVLLGH